MIDSTVKIRVVALRVTMVFTLRLLRARSRPWSLMAFVIAVHPSIHRRDRIQPSPAGKFAAAVLIWLVVGMLL